MAATAPPDSRVDRALLEALIVGVPMVTGLYALESVRTRRFGAMLLGAGVIWSLTALAESSNSVLYSVGRVSAWLIFPLLICLMLAFPTGRVAGGIDRMLIAGVTVLIGVFFIGSALFVDAYPAHTPWASCDADCPANAFLILDAEPALMDGVITPLREGIGVLLLIGVTLSIGARWKAATPLRRHVIGPVMATSMASTVALIAYLSTRRIAPGIEALDVLGRVWSLTIPAVATAFLIGLVRRRVAVGEVLSGLSFGLSRRLDRRQLRITLATQLDDQRLDVLVPDDTPGRWRDTEGRVTSLSAAIAGGRTVTVIDDVDDGTVAALVHSPELLDDDAELLEAVRALILATVRQERTMGKLAASLRALDVSRKRIARSADVERSRIERDLHDGAQQRLIGLRIKMSLAEELTRQDPAAGAAAMHDLGSDVELALEELRAVAHGVYPSVLSDRGLSDALRSVLRECSLAVHLSADELTRHPPEVETGVYFACLEAVQNATKHAHGATGLWVALHQDGDLRFEVRDDGAGFEPPVGDFNGGLRNMVDRMEAIGGRLMIETAPGSGTTIRGVVPLG